MAPSPSTEAVGDAQGLEELRALQGFMASALFRPLTASDRMQGQWTDGRPMSAVASGVIKPNEQLSAFERLEIYNRGYWFRLLDCLYDDFPAVLAVLGQKRFHRLITAYLTEHPSESFTLRDLGARFPAYLRENPALSAPYTAPAVEAALFEWAQVVAFDSEARPALSVDDFLGADPATLRLGLQPYVSLLPLEYPWDEFILKLREPEEEGRSVASNTVVEAGPRASRRSRRPAPERVRMVVHRYQNSVYYKRVDSAAFAILQALQSGLPLGEACARGAELAPEDGSFGPALQRWFHDWAALGWLCAA